MKKLLLATLFAFALPVLALTINPDSVSDTDTEVQTTPGSCLDLKGNMRYRMTGNEVYILQDFLITKGFLKSEATGYFGAMTFSAVKAYQSSLGWTPTGYAGPLTRAEIKKATCGGATTAATPFCGQPPMPVCPAGVSCIQAFPQPKTYTDNGAFLRDGASFLYSGACVGAGVTPPLSGPITISTGTLAGVYSTAAQLVEKAKSIKFANCLAVNGVRVHEGVGPCLAGLTTASTSSGGSTTTGGAKVIIKDDANNPDFTGLRMSNPSQKFPSSKPGEIILAYKVVYGSYSQPASLGVAYGPVFDLSISETPGFFPSSGTVYSASQDAQRTGNFYCFKSTVDPMVTRTLVTYPVKESESMSTQEGCKLTIGKTYYINLRYPLSNTSMSFGPGVTYSTYVFPEKNFQFWSAWTPAAPNAGNPVTQSSGPSCGSFPAGSCVAGTPSSMTTTANSYSWGCSAGGVTTSCSVERVIEKAPVISSLSAQKLHVVQPINGKTDLIGLAWKGDANTSSCILTGSSGYSKIIPATYYNLSPGNPWTWYDTDSSLAQDMTYAVTCFSHPSNFPSNTLTAAYRPTSTTVAPTPVISSFTAVSNYVNPGSTPTLTLKWVSNATSCTIGASTGFSPMPPNVMTDGVATGSTTINSPQQAMSYTLTCKNSAGASTPQTISVGATAATQATFSISPSSGTFNIGLSNPATLAFTLSGATQGDLEGCNEVVSHSNPGVTLTPGACSNSANFFTFNGNTEWKWVGTNLVGTFPYSASMWGAPGIQTKTVFRKKSAPTVQASMTISTTGTLSGTVSTAPTGRISVSPASCVLPVGVFGCMANVTWSSSNATPTEYASNIRTSGALQQFATSANGSLSVGPLGEGITTFYLKDGPLSTSNTLSTASFSVSCPAGSSWDGSSETCKAK